MRQRHNHVSCIHDGVLQIIEKDQPQEQDKTMYLLQSTHVDEWAYFRSRVHKDIDGILEDIRNAHAGRSDGARRPLFRRNCDRIWRK